MNDFDSNLNDDLFFTADVVDPETLARAFAGPDLASTLVRDDALGEVLLEANALSETLRQQRLGAMEATALLRTVMEELEVAVFAFDEGQRLRLANRAAENLMRRPVEQLLGRTAVAVPQPSQVGLDRLLGLVAAQALKRPAAGAIVVDLGTAITINRLSPGGAFEGGAILPGLRLAARSLATGTQQLPEAPTLAEVPAPLGVDTLSAMQSGIFWGAVGAIGEIVHRLAASAEYDLFLTGGGAALLAATLPSATQLSFKLIPHLTLSGIAICARRP